MSICSATSDSIRALSQREMTMPIARNHRLVEALRLRRWWPAAVPESAGTDHPPGEAFSLRRWWPAAVSELAGTDYRPGEASRSRRWWPAAIPESAGTDHPPSEAFRPRQWWPVVACVALALPLPHSASAQSADAIEPFLGTWSGVFTAQEHDWWTAADIACFVGCPRDFYEHLSALLADPANDSVPWRALAARSSQAWAAEFESQLTQTGRRVRDANTAESDPKFLNCQPYGFVRQTTNPLPMQIVRDGENLLVRYEEWALLRPIYMDGRGHPEHRTHTLLGHSIGRVEDGVLIVETERVTPDRISDETRIGHSDELTAVERYTVLDDPRRLELTLTLEDPVTFAGQMVIAQTWLYTPDVELVQDTCFQQPGKP